MTPTDASERERLIASLLDSALEKANDYDCESNVFDEEKAADILRADAEKIRALEEVVDEVRISAQAWRDSVRACDDDVGDVIREMADSIDAALAATQSPRSEAGEDVK